MAKIVYINAYSVARCYGGPEEGGWYYDAGTPLASVPIKSPINKAQPCAFGCGRDHETGHLITCKVLEDGSICCCLDTPFNACPIAAAEIAEHDKLVEAEKKRLTYSYQKDVLNRRASAEALKRGYRKMSVSYYLNMLLWKEWL